MSQALTFINPGVLERLKAGSFVPSRKSQGTSHQDRRDALSPLAITKRCIRYEPQVFQHRKALIVHMAESLNQAAPKILLLGGPQGSGKTSLVRGLIELMGARKREERSLQDPQLLWFEVNRHTDFEEIIQFLLQYITEVFTEATQESPATAQLDRRADRGRGNTLLEDPLQRLRLVIEQVSEMPLLLVLDNVEYIVDQNLRFNSYPFKELLNFLLGFPNIKMILLGERLPYADMSPNQSGVLEIALPPLDETNTLQHWQSQNISVEVDPGILEQTLQPELPAVLHTIYQRTQGLPWLVRTIDYLHQHDHIDFQRLHQSLQNSRQEPTQALLQLAMPTLTEQQQRLILTLSFLRHPVNAKTLLAMMNICFPVLDTQQPDESILTDWLEHSSIRPFVKVSFPPQQVLNHIRNRQKLGRSRKFPPWFELYFAAKQAIYQIVSPTEKNRIHDALQDFYLRDKSNEAEQRVLRIKNRALLAEAKYHGNLTREKGAKANEQEPSLNTKAYVYQQGRPPEIPVTPTLDDYRNIQVPEPEFTASSPEELPPASFSAILSELELNDEERHLLANSHEKTVEKIVVVKTNTIETVASPSPSADLDAYAETLKTFTKEQPSESTSESTPPPSEEQRIQRRLASAVAARDPHLMAKELLALAQYRASHGQYDAAIQCLEKALKLEAEADPICVAEIYRLAGHVYQKTYQHNLALGALHKAATLAEQLKQTEGSSTQWIQRLGTIYKDLGEIQAYRQHFSEAETSFQKALHWFQQIHTDTPLAEVYFQLANVYEDWKKPQQAVQCYQSALTIDEQNHNWHAMAASLTNLGYLAWNGNQLNEATQYFQRSLQCDQKSIDWNGQFETLKTLAELMEAQEHWVQSETYAQQGLSIAIQQASKLWQANFYVHLGKLATRQRQLKSARQHYERALSCGEKELSGESIAWLQHVISELS